MPLHANSRERDMNAKNNIGKILNKYSSVISLLEKNKPGKYFGVDDLIAELSSLDGQAIYRVMEIFLDISEDLVRISEDLKRENEALRSMALIDNLTGLYNNRFFLLQLDTEMARTRRTGLSCALLMVDLDNFKRINDTYGHLEGDRFLSDIGNCLKASVRPTDTVCRYGGDEFTVIMPATGYPEAKRIADRLRKAAELLSKPLNLGVATSIGVAEYTVNRNWDAKEFIHAADQSMYDIKKNRKKRFHGQEITERPGEAAQPVTVEEKEAIFGLYDELRTEGEE